MEVGLVTWAGLPGLAADDALLVPALAARGLHAGPVVWDDPQVDWAAIRLCVIRSTWDYHYRPGAFMDWVGEAAARTALWNPPAALRWNSHKGYLRDLAARGVPIVPTVHLAAGAPAELAATLATAGWTRAVLKPAVSASAFATTLVDVTTLPAGQVHLDTWLPTHDMLVQPYLSTVETVGERSLMFVDGELSHAVRRAPVLGDRYDPDGQAPPVTPAPDEVALAQEVLQIAGFPTLYARVDLIRDESGTLRLMELELIEPSLFLLTAPAAVDRLAAAIAARCGAAGR